MAEFLSPAWIAELDRAARSAQAPPEVHLVIQQTVVDGDGPEVSYVMRIDKGAVSVAAGRAEDADLTLSQDRATAVAIARGDLSAQAAFMSGRLRVGGDLRMAMDRARELATIADVFAAARQTTTW